MAGGRTTKHDAAKYLLGILATSISTSGKKVAQHLGLSKRCVLNYKEQCLFIDNGDLDFWFKTNQKITVKCIVSRGKSFCARMVDHGDYHIS
jgi:hypothetical protein